MTDGWLESMFFWRKMSGRAIVEHSVQTSASFIWPNVASFFESTSSTLWDPSEGAGCVAWVQYFIRIRPKSQPDPKDKSAHPKQETLPKKHRHQKPHGHKTHPGLPTTKAKPDFTQLNPTQQKPKQKWPTKTLQNKKNISSLCLGIFLHRCYQFHLREVATALGLSDTEGFNEVVGGGKISHKPSRLNYYMPRKRTQKPFLNGQDGDNVLQVLREIYSDTWWLNKNIAIRRSKWLLYIYIYMNRKGIKKSKRKHLRIVHTESIYCINVWY